jgi:pyruvate dehydrogenase E1 component beta subunit
MRELTYAEAINEALHQGMELSDDVMVLGQLVDYQSGIFGTTTGLVEKFGADRVQDFPVAESVMTSAAIGAALAGMRPVLVHQRLDFMLYSLDAIVNWMSLWRFKTDGKSGLPITIRAIVGRGWGQGPQHSKSLHAWFAHLPGIRVVMPATAYDAKGLLLESMFGEDPTIIIENRSLFSMTDFVPEIPFRVRMGQAEIRRSGADLTLVAIGSMVPMALRVASTLAGESIDVEVIDMRTVSPLDMDTVLKSVGKTKRLAVADPGWQSVGVAAEIISSVCERIGPELLSAPIRVCLPDSHTPMTAKLEAQYYPTDDSIAEATRNLMRSVSVRH